MGEKQKTINKKQIAEFIQSLLPVEENFDFKKMAMFFSSEDLGTLYLNNEEFINYRRVLQSIIDNLETEIISPKAIEKLFQHAILKSLDLNNKKSEVPLDHRIKNSINDFGKSLREEPRKIDLYFQIEGLAKEGLPFNFGKVEFCVFDANIHSLFIKTVEKNWNDGPTKKMLMEEINRMEKWKLNESPVGKIKVDAIDLEAAYYIGIKNLFLSINILNFYSDLIPYHNGFIFLPGESQQTYVEIPMLAVGEKPGVHFKYHRVGSIMNFSIEKLREADIKNNLGLARASELLLKDQNNLEERIISALRWAGSAMVEKDKEKAFLEYAISLETLILFENNKDELTYRLQTRVAQLLSEDYEICEKISNDIKKLYVTRSDIVHNGKYQVTDSELKLIRFYAKSSILRLLVGSEFTSMDVAGLLGWFNKRTFR